MRRYSRPVEFGVVGVVVLGVDLVLRDTQGVAEFTVSNRFFIWRILLRETFKEANIFACELQYHIKCGTGLLKRILREALKNIICTITDSARFRIVAPAPLFDHGNALFNYAGRDALASEKNLNNAKRRGRFEQIPII